MYTLYFEYAGANLMLLIISLISSTPLLDAASISIISAFSLKCLQLSHSLHGPSDVGFKQFMALAKTLAVLVFPVPLGPEKI